jgi:hypothetical protein
MINGKPETTDMPITEDEIQRMPWTRDLMTDDELKRWVESRKEAGLAINIDSCELGRWYANDLDPYGVSRDPDLYVQVGTNRFVRSPESDGWVNEGDLPVEKVWAMYDRIDREWEARAEAHPDDPGVRHVPSRTTRGMNENKTPAERYRLDQAQKLLDLFEDTQGRPAKSAEELAQWASMCWHRIPIPF